MSTQVRVRFAPSPTGYLHIGGVRSALFNWLWARHNGGVFVLRLEDTDRARYVPESVEQIKASLDWLGITPDEGPAQGGQYGPYVQSERLELYRHHADQLVTKGALYPCWCTPERLDGLRSAAQKAGQPFKYDRHCLDHPKSLDEPHVLRFKVPDQTEPIAWDDEVRGRLEFAAAELDDFVALKSDGYPTYHLANVVDDHLMAITDVLRADEWIPSTPKHLLLFAAFGWEPPRYAHLPQVLGADKTKLSKRHGAKSALEYRDDGYLPQAVVNFLAALGWNEGDGSTKEIYSKDELVKAFSLERVQSSPAVFDGERLDWLNGKYIRDSSWDDLAPLTEPFWPNEAKGSDNSYRQRVFALVQDRLKKLSELAELVIFFFVDPSVAAEALTKDFSAREAREHLSDITGKLETIGWTENTIEATIRAYVETNGLKTGQLFGLLRQAITGRAAAPGLFETMAVLGQETTLRRLSNAVKQL
jgi:glutamyl-tRNA synthetase